MWFAFKIVSLTYRKQRQSAIIDRYCVVICFQNCIFDISKTAAADLLNFYFCCDLLSKLYLWHIENSLVVPSEPTTTVVICFQNCIFDISKTAAVSGKEGSYKLWFAFKIVSLTYRKQPNCNKVIIFDSCDLLSKLYLWHIENSAVIFKVEFFEVVICFQNCIFDISKTAQCVYCVGNQRIIMSVRKEKSLCFRLRIPSKRRDSFILK